jgi:hypothetical protein
MNDLYLLRSYVVRALTYIISHKNAQPLCKLADRMRIYAFFTLRECEFLYACAIEFCDGVVVYSVLTDMLFLAIVLAVLVVAVRLGRKIG